MLGNEAIAIIIFLCSLENRALEINAFLVIHEAPTVVIAKINIKKEITNAYKAQLTFIGDLLLVLVLMCVFDFFMSKLDVINNFFRCRA